MEPEHHHLLPVFRACPPLKAPIRIVPFPFVIFFRPKFTRRAHTHTRTHWLRSFPVSTATMPPFLLRSFFSPLLPANSLRFQLQTLVRPFLIIFQLPTFPRATVFVYHSPGIQLFFPLPLSLEDFERRGNFRNGEECGGDVSIVRLRRFAISTNPKKNREESREKRTKLNL